MAGPRYSNHVKYLSASYPLQDSPPDGKFCIGKFNDTFTNITFVQISQTTDREKIGDLWLADGEGPMKSVKLRAQQSRRGLLLVFTLSRTTVSVSYDGVKTLTARLIDVGGRIAASAVGISSCTIDTRAIRPGRYALEVTADGSRSVREAVLCGK